MSSISLGRYRNLQFTSDFDYWSAFLSNSFCNRARNNNLNSLGLVNNKSIFIFNVAKLDLKRIICTFQICEEVAH